MGYTTEFIGSFSFDKKLDEETYEFLVKLSKTRRMKRNVDETIYGKEGEFYVEGKGYCGQDIEANIIDYNNPPGEQPGLWLHWIPSEDRKHLKFDGGEKFYNYIEWLKYLIEKVFEPKKYILNGEICWQGEDEEDTGTIRIKDNDISVFYEK